MSNRRDGGDIIHIIGGDEADNQDRERSGAATSNLTYGGGYRAMVSEPSQIPTFGSSSFVVVENNRSYRSRHCKLYYTEAGCRFGEKCYYIHDENAKARESLAVIAARNSGGGGYRNAAATGNDGGPAAPLPPAPLPARPLAATAGTLPLARLPLLAQTVSSPSVKPWRTKICNRWKQTSYCEYGINCTFAHGEAELQRGGGPVQRDANIRAMVENLPAPSGPSAGHVVTTHVADAGGSRRISGVMQGSIPSKNPWKVSKKINGIYGDWIDDSLP